MGLRMCDRRLSLIFLHRLRRPETGCLYRCVHCRQFIFATHDDADGAEVVVRKTATPINRTTGRTGDRRVALRHVPRFNGG